MKAFFFAGISVTLALAQTSCSVEQQQQREECVSPRLDGECPDKSEAQVGMNTLGCVPQQVKVDEGPSRIVVGDAGRVSCCYLVRYAETTDIVFWERCQD